MVSTSMHSMPGCPIMKSNNLKDWEIVNYVLIRSKIMMPTIYQTVKAFMGKAHGLQACVIITEPIMYASPAMIVSSSIFIGRKISNTALGSVQ